MELPLPARHTNIIRNHRLMGGSRARSVRRVNRGEPGVDGVATAAVLALPSDEEGKGGEGKGEEGLGSDEEHKGGEGKAGEDLGDRHNGELEPVDGVAAGGGAGAGAGAGAPDVAPIGDGHGTSRPRGMPTRAAIAAMHGLPAQPVVLGRSVSDGGTSGGAPGDAAAIPGPPLSPPAMHQRSISMGFGSAAVAMAAAAAWRRRNRQRLARSASVTGGRPRSRGDVPTLPWSHGGVVRTGGANPPAAPSPATRGVGGATAAAGTVASIAVPAPVTGVAGLHRGGAGSRSPAVTRTAMSSARRRQEASAAAAGASPE